MGGWMSGLVGRKIHEERDGVMMNGWMVVG